jgi:hypothetical protein
MAILKIIGLATILFLSVQLQDKPQLPDSYKIINIAPQTGIINFSDIFSDYKIYRLKSAGKNFLKAVTRVYPIDDKLIVKGQSDVSLVHIFNKKGDYLTNVGVTGKGPSEYFSIRSLKVYPSLKTIEILDYNRNTILRFSSDNGKFLNEFKIDAEINPDEFEKTDNNNYLFFEKLPLPDGKFPGNKVKLYSVKEKKAVKQFFPVDPVFSKYLFFGELSNFYQISNSICFYTVFTDTVFTISDRSVDIKYVFNAGKYGIKKNVLYGDYNDVRQFVNKCIESSCIWNINRLLETKSFLFFSFNYKKDFFYSFYNKTNNKILSSSQFNDDMVFNKTGNAIDIIKPVGAGDNSLFFKIETPEFLKSVDELKKNLSPQQWQKYCDSHKQIIDLSNTIDINENDLIIEFLFKN